jgi:hypothetical protein
MTDEQRKRLRELAAEASPGPWTLEEDGSSTLIKAADDSYVHENTCYYPSGLSSADEEFIKEANPAAVVELLDENEKAIAALKQIAAGEGHIPWNDCCCGNLAKKALK